MEYLCLCLGTSYVMYFFTICCGICKEEYLEKKKKIQKIKKQYNNFKKIDFDIEMQLESNCKLSTIEEKDEDESKLLY